MSKAKKKSPVIEDLEAHNSEEDHYWKIKEGMGEFFWDSDSDLKITYCSSKVIESLWLTSKEFVGKTLFDFIDELTFEWFQKKLIGLISHSVDHMVMECPLPTIGGETKWFLIKVKLLMNEEGHAIGFRGTGLDVDSEHKIEKEYIFQKEKSIISSKVASMLEMSRGVAHEINNRFNNFSGEYFSN